MKRANAKIAHIRAFCPKTVSSSFRQASTFFRLSLLLLFASSLALLRSMISDGSTVFVFCRIREGGDSRILDLTVHTSHLAL